MTRSVGWLAGVLAIAMMAAGPPGAVAQEDSIEKPEYALAFNGWLVIRLANTDTCLLLRHVDFPSQAIFAEDLPTGRITIAGIDPSINTGEGIDDLERQVQVRFNGGRVGQRVFEGIGGPFEAEGVPGVKLITRIAERSAVLDAISGAETMTFVIGGVEQPSLSLKSVASTMPWLAECAERDLIPMRNVDRGEN